jgi:hypothetical protein
MSAGGNVDRKIGVENGARAAGGASIERCRELRETAQAVEQVEEPDAIGFERKSASKRCGERRHSGVRPKGVHRAASADTGVERCPWT